MYRVVHLYISFKDKVMKNNSNTSSCDCRADVNRP